MRPSWTSEAGADHTILDLVRLLENELARPLDVRYEPPRPGDVRDTEANITPCAAGYLPFPPGWISKPG